MSLSGYEELAGEGDDTATAEETTIDETTSDYDATRDDTTAEVSEYHDHEHDDDDQHHYHQQRANDAVDDSLLEDATITGSTPRVPSTKSTHPQFADFDSPYQALRRELKGGSVFKDDLPADDDDEDEDEYGDAADGTTRLPPYHHGTTSRLPDMSMTPRSSSLLLDEPTQQHKSTALKSKDLLLHRVLDKNYRLQATPLKTVPLPPRTRGRSPQKKSMLEEEPEEDRTRRALWAESPMSSPEMTVPKLRSDLYMSPAKTRRRSGAAAGAPRTPGVSVQTPTTARKRDIFAEARDKDNDKGKGKGKARERDEIAWDSDEDDEIDSVFGGMSPPKTIQFALPASKLMQTPGKSTHSSSCLTDRYECREWMVYTS